MLAAAGKPDDVNHEMMVSEAVEETKTAVITESTDKEEISALTKAEQDKAARHASREARSHNHALAGTGAARQ